MNGFIARLWGAIDSEKVLPFQIVQYTCYLAGGLYMVFFGKAPSTVYRALGSGTHNIWTTMVIVSPLVLFLGLRLKEKYSGMWIQLAGDIGMLGALAVYISSIFQADWLGKGIFGVWGFVGLTFWSLLFVVRDARRIIQTEKKAREL